MDTYKYIDITFDSGPETVGLSPLSNDSYVPYFKINSLPIYRRDGDSKLLYFPRWMNVLFSFFYHIRSDYQKGDGKHQQRASKQVAVLYHNKVLREKWQTIICLAYCDQTSYQDLDNTDIMNHKREILQDLKDNGYESE